MLGIDSKSLLWPTCVHGDLVEDIGGSELTDVFCRNSHCQCEFSYVSDPVKGVGDGNMAIYIPRALLLMTNASVATKIFSKVDKAIHWSKTPCMEWNRSQGMGPRNSKNFAVTG